MHTQTQYAVPTTVESSPQSTSTAAVPKSPTPSAAEVYVVTHVRALYSFEPTEPNELAFERGDIIKVVDRKYEGRWRGQLRGRTGIFPVNYVEPLPDLTTAELAAEVQQDAAVFSQAANFDRLLTMLRTLDPARDNVADNEEIQELYASCMALRPKIVKLIDKYNQKCADLMSMNESFVRARPIFDRMMDDSLARHSGFFEQQYTPLPQSQSLYSAWGESHVQGQQVLGYGPPADQPQNLSVYNQARYGVFPTPEVAYAESRQGGPIPDPHVSLGRSASYVARQLQTQPQPQRRPSFQQVQQTQQPQLQTAYVQPYLPPRASFFLQTPSQQAEAPLETEQTPSLGQPQNQQPHQDPMQWHPLIQHAQQHTLVQSQSQLQHTHAQALYYAQPQTQSVAQQQPRSRTQSLYSFTDTPSHAQPQPQLQANAQARQALTGPPFVSNPTATYPRQNVQVWAQFYKATTVL